MYRERKAEAMIPSRTYMGSYGTHESPRFTGRLYISASTRHIARLCVGILFRSPYTHSIYSSLSYILPVELPTIPGLRSISERVSSNISVQVFLLWLKAGPANT